MINLLSLLWKWYTDDVCEKPAVSHLAHAIIQLASHRYQVIYHFHNKDIVSSIFKGANP